ncbi:uncharacterized protein LOC126898156 [Daktulosphaira vitifoliae]|uniref:uncharacterized protein LOC126898156 n=1 Tax=Daktulosphaira vitifoliae TaxID=58002 RepID=UPI0021AA7B51|nr:uncharacterized protein LOC126898156 [Daktulosphaira vitifoliae]
MADNDLHAILEEEFNKLMHEEEVYQSKGSGFSIDSVEGLLLSVIMAKYVDAPNPSRISHYLNAPVNYDFSELNYPVEVKDVKKFEKGNPGVSVNVYGLKICEPTCNVDKIHNPPKNKEYIVVPYKINDQELNNHFDILLFNDDESTNGDKYHYAYIKNFSRLLVSNAQTAQRLFNKPNFKYITYYTDEFCAIHLFHDALIFDKPIYAGFSVLEISKTLMYDFHYNTMRKMYNGHIELCYMDTDSLIYFIHTEDFYDDVLKKPGFLEKLDTSNLDPNHKCYRTERAKLPGTFTDEALGKIIAELIALRSKSYGYEMDGKEKIKAKGVSKIVVSNHVTLMDHKQCLFKGLSTPHIQEVDDNYSAEREMISFRSIKHKIKTMKTRKLALNRYDDKRIVGTE